MRKRMSPDFRFPEVGISAKGHTRHVYYCYGPTIIYIYKVTKIERAL